MIPLDTEITYLKGSEILQGTVWANGRFLTVALTTDDGLVRRRITHEDIQEIFAEKVYTVIVTNVNDGKTRAKTFYVKEKAESYHRKCFEHSGWVVSWAEHRISSWILYQKSRW